MSNKLKLQSFEARSRVEAAWFGRAVRKGRWSKASAIVGGLGFGLGTLAEAQEAQDHESVRDELLRASTMIDEITLHVSEKAQTAALEAYGAFLSYLPEAHARLGALVDDDPGTRGGDKKQVMLMATERAMNVLGLG